MRGNNNRANLLPLHDNSIFTSKAALAAALSARVRDVNMYTAPPELLRFCKRLSYELAMVIKANDDCSGASTAGVDTAFLCLGHTFARQEAF